jgi:hypothetical protein
VTGAGGAGGADAGAMGGSEAVREVVALRSASAAVEVVCAAMLALWIGTTGAMGGSGGFLRKGATIAWGTLRIRHSCPLSGLPDLSRGL